MKKGLGIMYANVAVLAAAALLYFALASPKSVTAMTQSTAFPIYRGSSRDSVAIQCAVSWNAASMETILDELNRANVRITFLVSGRWAEENPDLLRRIWEEGHEIGVMGFEPEKDGGPGFVKNDIERALDAVSAVTGERPSTYFCGGRDASVSAAAGNALGLCTVLYSIDPDCSGADAELILKRIENGVRPGFIINVQPTASFAQALPRILDYLKNMGFAIVPTYKMLYN